MTPHTDEHVRLLILACGNPEADRPFSGSLKSLCQALEARGIVHHKANVAGYTDSFERGSLPIRLLRRVDRFHLLGHYRWSRLGFYRNTQRAMRAAAEHPGFNACLIYGTSFNPPLDVPLYCYFDATAAQVYEARMWEFGHFSPRKAAAVVRLQQEIFDACTAVFPRTEWAAASVREDYGLPEDRIAIAGAGPNYFAEPLPHGPYDRQTILFIGRRFEPKGGAIILEAFRKVRKTLPDARFVIIGCTPAIDEPGVEVVGPISKSDAGGTDRLLQYYSEASVFCLMSCFEAFGISVVEAQNCFVPCVVPQRFAFQETVIDGVTGRHVPEYNAGLLAGILEEMLRDPARLKAMGEAGHRYVRERYTWQAAAEIIHRRIEQDLASRR